MVPELQTSGIFRDGAVIFSGFTLQFRLWQTELCEWLSGWRQGESCARVFWMWGGLRRLRGFVVSLLKHEHSLARGHENSRGRGQTVPAPVNVNRWKVRGILRGTQMAL
jgi:hypothetical protein